MRKYKFEEYIKNRPKFTRIRLKLKEAQRGFQSSPKSSVNFPQDKEIIFKDDFQKSLTHGLLVCVRRTS